MLESSVLFWVCADPRDSEGAVAADGMSWECVFSVGASLPVSSGAQCLWVTTLSAFTNVVSLRPWFSISMKEIGKSAVSLTVKINHTNMLSFEN